MARELKVESRKSGKVTFALIENGQRIATVLAYPYNVYPIGSKKVLLTPTERIQCLMEVKKTILA